MKTVRAVALAIIAGALASPHLSAQTCLGSAPFTDGPMRVGAGATRMSIEGFSLDSYNAQITYGVPDQGYASLTWANRPAQNGALAENEFTGRLGLQQQAGGSLQWCPFVGGSYAIASGSYGTHHAATYTVGSSIGFTTRLSESVSLVPALGLDYDLANGDGSPSWSYGWAAIGAGVVVNRRVTFTPSFSRLIGVTGPPLERYGIGVSYSFGKK